MEIFDCNAFFGFWPRREIKADLETIKNLASSHGIKKLLLSSFRGIVDDFTLGNRETIEACRVNPYMFPVATINPHRFLGLNQELAELEKEGVKVFRFFPDYQHWPYRFAPFNRVLRSLNSGSLIILPARIGEHHNNGVISEIGELAGEFGFNFIITGVYYGDLAEAIVVAQEHTNVFIETSLVNSPDGIEILTEHLGAEKLVYGSQMPLNYVSASLYPIMNARISDKDKERILCKNIIGLLGGEE